MSKSTNPEGRPRDLPLSSLGEAMDAVRGSMTLAEWALRVGVSPQVMSAWRAGTRRPGGVARRWLDSLGVRIPPDAIPRRYDAIHAALLGPLGEAIDRARGPMSLRVFAIRLGVSLPTLAAWRYGSSRPSEPHRARLRELGVELPPEEPRLFGRQRVCLHATTTPAPPDPAWPAGSSICTSCSAIVPPAPAV